MLQLLPDRQSPVGRKAHCGAGSESSAQRRLPYLDQARISTRLILMPTLVKTHPYPRPFQALQVGGVLGRARVVVVGFGLVDAISNFRHVFLLFILSLCV